MKIYSFPVSPAGKRVRICAAELGVAIDPRFVDPMKGEQRLPDYLALNPMGKVPTLVEGDFVLWESAAILWHLVQSRDPEGRLWPKDLRAQSDTMRWLFFGASHIDPYVTTLVVERLLNTRRGLPRDETLDRSANEWLARFLPVVDQRLAERDYVAGSFGLADITLGCTIELAPILELDLSAYPNVGAWLGRLQGRPSWRGREPDAFPRTPV